MPTRWFGATRGVAAARASPAASRSGKWRSSPLVARRAQDVITADNGAVGRTIRFAGIATTLTTALLIWPPLSQAPALVSGATEYGASGHLSVAAGARDHTDHGPNLRRTVRAARPRGSPRSRLAILALAFATSLAALVGRGLDAARSQSGVPRVDVRGGVRRKDACGSRERMNETLAGRVMVNRRVSVSCSFGACVRAARARHVLDRTQTYAPRTDGDHRRGRPRSLFRLLRSVVHGAGTRSGPQRSGTWLPRARIDCGVGA